MTAEQSDYTVSDGPCSAVHDDHAPVWATEAVIARSWPLLADRLFGRTGLRSAFAFPVGGYRSPLVITVYFAAAHGCLSVSLAAAVEVAALVRSGISQDADLLAGCHLGGWPFPAGQPRQRLPIAVGLLTAALTVSTGHALTLLRAHAFAADRTIDEVASAVVDRTLTPNQLTDQ